MQTNRRLIVLMPILLSVAVNGGIISESVLKIEYLNGAKVEETIQKAIDTLESTYSVTFSTDLFSLQQEHQLTSIYIALRDRASSTTPRIIGMTSSVGSKSFVL